MYLFAGRWHAFSISYVTDMLVRLGGGPPVVPWIVAAMQELADWLENLGLFEHTQCVTESRIDSQFY